MSLEGKYVFGIDLGTTYSCIAYVDENGIPTVVKNSEGDNTTPSVVYFDDMENITVGQVAKDNAITEPEKTISFVKEHMGKDDFDFSVDGQKVTPEEVSAKILRKVTQDASQMLGTEVKDVVITCPAYFGNDECQATKNAGIIAGLNVLSIIREPGAAALCYLTKGQSQDDQTVLVYDLGGGTFDITVMNVSGGSKADIVCYEGDQGLGGHQWDQALVEYFKDKYIEEAGEVSEWLPEDLQDMQGKAESAKKILSGKDKTKVSLNFGKRVTIEITRDIFNSITQSLLKRTLDSTDRAIAMALAKKAQGSKEDIPDELLSSELEKLREDPKGVAAGIIDGILLVGGSTRMPQVSEALEERYGIELQLLEPDEAVAKGAAMAALAEYQGRVEEWKEKIESGEVDLNDAAVKEEVEKYKEEAAVKHISLPGMANKKVSALRGAVNMAATKSYALQVMVDDTEKYQNLIIKNSKMTDGAVTVTQEFTTYEANQANAVLTICESDMSTEFYELNEVEMGNAIELNSSILELPSNLPIHSPIEVTFKLTKEGLLEVHAIEKTGGKEINVTIDPKSKSVLSADEVAKKAAAEQNKNIE